MTEMRIDRDGTMPLQRHPLLNAQDIDEYHALVSGLAGQHRRRQLEAGRFRCRVNGAVRHELGLHAVSYNRGLSLEVPGGHTMCYLHLYRKGSGVYEFADERIVGDIDHAVLLHPGEAYTATFSALETFVLGIDGPFMARELTSRGGGNLASSRRLSHRLDLRGGSGRIVRDLLNVLRFSLEDGGPGLLGHDLSRRSLAGALVGALLADQADDRESRRSNRDGRRLSRSLAIVEDFIEENLERPLSLGDLCQAAGLGSRTLQRAGLSRWGLSPLAYVAQRRLDRAHGMLSSARSGATVSHIALACGFYHLGRFAASYGERFGEVPSATLARAHRHGRG